MTKNIYDHYLEYKEDMLESEEIELRDLTLEDFISKKLYRSRLTAKRGCYKIKRSWWKIFGKDEVFCSFKY